MYPCKKNIQRQNAISLLHHCSLWWSPVFTDHVDGLNIVIICLNTFNYTCQYDVDEFLSKSRVLF